MTTRSEAMFQNRVTDWNTQGRTLVREISQKLLMTCSRCATDANWEVNPGTGGRIPTISEQIETLMSYLAIDHTNCREGEKQ